MEEKIKIYVRSKNKIYIFFKDEIYFFENQELESGGGWVVVDGDLGHLCGGAVV